MRRGTQSAGTLGGLEAEFSEEGDSGEGAWALFREGRRSQPVGFLSEPQQTPDREKGSDQKKNGDA